MLDPAWPLTPAVLWVGIVGLIAVLVLRAIRKDRREYQRFKRYRTTRRRQAMFRRWLLSSFATFGGLSVAVLLLASAWVQPLLDELAGWPVLRDIRRMLFANLPLAVVIAGVVVLGLAVLTVLGARALRQDGESAPAIGDIRSILPRNRQELRLGALLAFNAGVVEELLFRLALPALIFGATGSSLAAVLGSIALFGALHLYQGAVGVIGTGVVGALMMVVYVVTGTIAVPIVLHVLFDLRSLVAIPMLVDRVHRVDGARPRVSIRAREGATQPPLTE